ncbi:GNAT family N-acetyltransferase [Ureibacillus manganicus]|uniref:GNAT family acetyltransferase n=1 Tax=Ureibacillus manganicus DSM 26584 TaxID=1384049 RepID=A0A0A3I3A8_9BACL|nr:GNAT family N-acetyltransferase [Ureibacillus manganicus]KGR77990.1 GNAT family acetyltransferase [Ureibacillus manganicus DSM 26584]
MTKILLVPQNIDFAKAMSSLSSAPEVKNALGMTDEQTSLEGTVEFIEYILEQEKLGKQYSRVILNENGDLIGVITIKDINEANKTAHIGTWIGHQYWGKGYNELAKLEILHTAFTELDLDFVFAGAKLSNIRSQKAQEKLPYIRIDVQSEFPDEHKKLEFQVKAPCILNVIEKEMFLKWYSENKK